MSLRTDLTTQQIVALRNLFLNWGLLADEIPPDFFRFGHEASWCSPELAGFILNTFCWVGSNFTPQQYYQLNPNLNFDHRHRQVNGWTIAEAYLPFSGLYLSHMIIEPNHMPRSWQLERRCLSCGTDPGTDSLYQDVDCPICRGMGLKFSTDQGLITEF